MKFDLILNKDITSSVDAPVEFSLNNKENKCNCINILVCEEPKFNIEKPITDSSKKQKLKIGDGSKKRSRVWYPLIFGFCTSEKLKSELFILLINFLKFPQQTYQVNVCFRIQEML
ncbi:16003_t:CDS:1 [Cetraspora pellucida]|uniref:16003_t:CDS:1 n=1 Tax=Cetraspora pellucida TaxID=1433469 RepID=A0ACA9MS99_9GLOM|nr:16003_t:CDS:1 [Cetraspora pellucida]